MLRKTPVSLNCLFLPCDLMEMLKNTCINSPCALIIFVIILSLPNYFPYLWMVGLTLPLASLNIAYTFYKCHYFAPNQKKGKGHHFFVAIAKLG